MRKLLFLILCMAAGIAAMAKTIYVKPTATGTNNGSSWLHAYVRLDSALRASIAGDTVKVATDTYKPGSSYDATFFMKSGVVVLGGYANDTTITTRNWSLYPTILSGDIGTPNVAYDNLTTVLTGRDVSGTTVWDGFIVEHCEGHSDSYEGAVVLTHNSGAVLRNFVFRHNRSSNQGSALTCVNSAPTLINTVFYANNELGYFARGTVFSADGNPRFYNCVFAANYSSDSASALYLSGGLPEIVNCTFFNNKSAAKGGAVVGINGAVLTISNSIFFENKLIQNSTYDLTNSDSSDVVLFNATAQVSHSITQGFKSGVALQVSANPRFRDTADLDGPDDRFFTTDDGLQLTNPCSPGLNAGANSLPADITLDILGNPRRFNSGVPDLGAYEYQGLPVAPLRVVYVNKNATGSNDGSSWANAFNDLQKALLYCADTIKVAAGTYTPSAADQRSSFWLQNKMVVLGGYPASGNPGEAMRNPATYPTVLSGQLPTHEKVLVVVKSRNNDSTAVLDGVTIRDCDNSWMPSAGLELTNESAPLLRHCRITANSYGVVGRRQSTGTFSQCTIDSNAVSGSALDHAAPHFIRCSFTGNTTIIDVSLDMYAGGGVVALYSAPLFDTCAFTGNKANRFGGAIYNQNSNAVFNYCVFEKNGAPAAGSDVYNLSSSPRFTHCLFRDSDGNEKGGSIYNENSSPEFRFCAFLGAHIARQGSTVYNTASAPFFISCVFSNSRTFDAPAHVIYSVSNSQLTLRNCVSVGNSGVAASFLYNSRTATQMINCTVLRNSTARQPLIYNTDGSHLVMQNSILWGNNNALLPSPSWDMVNSGTGADTSTATISHSITQAFGIQGENGNLVGLNPRLVADWDADGPDNLFFTADDGFRITPCSPALNSGDNSAVTDVADFPGNTRLYGVVDMGAYEYQSSPASVPKTYYVNAAATGANDGTSWANAYTSLWQAINNICADTIKVAAGTYRPATTNRDSAFLVQHGKVFLGGYPASGAPTDADRDPVRYPTILSGNIGSPSDSTDNSHHVVYVFCADSAVVIDGFTIQEGRADNNSTPSSSLLDKSGSGVLNYNSKLTIANCLLQKNVATEGGGLASFLSPRLKVRKTIVSGNRSIWGGGVYVSLAGGEKTLVENSVITHNTASRGGGMYVDGNVDFYAPGMDLNNLVFYQNEAEDKGGGLFLNSPYKVSVVNSTFFKNKAWVTAGSGIYSNFNYQQDNGFPLLYNNIFHRNSYGTSDENYGGSDIFESTCANFYCYRPNIRYNRTQFPINQYDMNNTTAWPEFVNEADPDGADNTWMTEDDGLRLTPCSPLLNYGLSAPVATIPADILGQSRVVAGKPDLGAYEFTGASRGALLLDQADDSLTADKEYTTADGWTHYYKGCDYLLSLQKNGQDIGTVGDSAFRLTITTTPPYGSGQATNLTAARYNTSGQPWLAMNRYWKVTPTHPVTDSILVRFPYTQKDFTDLQGSNPALTSPEQITFFHVGGTENPFDTTASADAFRPYTYGAAPSLTTWSGSRVDSLYFSEYYVPGFSGGSGGTYYTGPLPDVTLSAGTLSPGSAAPNEKITINLTEVNRGTGAAGNHQVSIYLSTDDKLTPGKNGDTLLSKKAISGPLAAGGNTGDLAHAFYLPCSVIPGNYTLFLVADGDNVLPETSEDNNQLALPLTIKQGRSLPPVPVLTAEPADTICSPGHAVVKVAPAECVGCTYNWKGVPPDGNGGIQTINDKDSLTAYFSGTYTYTLTNACGSSATSQVVTILPQPDVTLSAAPYAMCLEEAYTLSASGADTYTWSGPGLSADTGSSVTVQPLAAGRQMYQITGTDTHGCSKTRTYFFDVNPKPVVDLFQSDFSICQGTTITLQAAGTGVEGFSWTPNSNLAVGPYGQTVTTTPAATTKYVATGSTIWGCTASDSATVTVLPAGSCPSPLADLTIGYPAASTLSATSGESIRITFFNVNQGAATAGAHKVSFYLSPDGQLTPGSNGDVLLGEYASAGLSAYTVSSWLSKDLTLPCNVTAGSYTLFLVADGGRVITESSETNNAVACQSKLQISPLSATLTASPGTVCSGSTVTLTASGRASSYTWSGSGLQSFSGSTVTAVPTITTVYTATASLNGCTASSTTTVTVRPGPDVRITAPESVICPGGSVILTASGANSYTWSPSTGLNATTGSTVTASPAATTTYTAMGSDGTCIQVASYTVTVTQASLPTITISYSGCPSNTLLFTANITNGGSTPVIEWYVNNVLVGTGATFNLANATNGMQVFARLTSSSTCASIQTVSSAITTVNCTATAVSDINGLESFSIAPNPSDGYFVVKLKLSLARKVSFTVKDMLGKVVYSTPTTTASGVYNRYIDLRPQAAGMYYLETIINDKTCIMKIIIQR